MPNSSSIISLLLHFLLLFAFVALSLADDRPAGSWKNTVLCYEGIENATQNATNKFSPWLGDEYICRDSLEYEHRQCMKIVCELPEPWGNMIWRSCGACDHMREQWQDTMYGKPMGFPHFLKKRCECFECTDKALCNGVGIGGGGGGTAASGLAMAMFLLLLSGCFFYPLANIKSAAFF